VSRKETTDRETTPEAIDEDRRDDEPDRTWADEAAKARTADDPRARTPKDAVGQPTNRPFDE
jgi:hypothetical protein